ncbi:MAG: RIP metalloprotease RseP [Bryobacterales bacterium]|nr:RIP metalloprotease RseP [Bryobacterales bacterium]
MFGFDSAFYFLFLIGVLITIHELGHFWAARYFGVRVESCNFGFGPRLFGWKSGGTDFCVRALLFGGYVKMEGEPFGDATAVHEPDSLLAKPRWQRLIVYFAGPAMNIILAVGVLTGLYMVKFPKPPDTSISGMVGKVMPDSPAARAGIKEGDRVVAFAGMENPTWADVMGKVLGYPEQKLPVTVLRGQERVELTLIPDRNKSDGLGSVGMWEHTEIQVSEVEPNMDAAKQGLRSGDLILAVQGQTIRSADKLVELIRSSEGKPVSVTYSRQDGPPQSIAVQPAMTDVEGKQVWRIGVRLQPKVTYIQLGPAEALREAVRQNIVYASLIYDFLGGLLERRMSAKSIEGPVGIARASVDAARAGLPEYLQLMSGISLNLAIFNLLPIPILDGSIILMLLMEMFIRRDFSKQVKETVLQFGFVFLIAVVAFVLYIDITKVLSKS